MSKMWKMLNKIWPKFNTQATAKQNHLGKIVSTPRALKSSLIREYKERLRVRPVKVELEHLMITKKKILKTKMKLASFDKTPDWNKQDLDKALVKLKKQQIKRF